MELRPLEHVAVWLDDSGADARVFPQALDWAFRLNLPLRAVVTSPRLNTDSARPERSNLPIAHKTKAWEQACTQCGVPLEMFIWLGDGTAAMKRFLRPNGLCVCADRSDGAQEDLLRQITGGHENAILLCAPECQPLTRILVLCDQAELDTTYLESVARLCQAVEMDPIILIVARTAREGQRRRGYAECVCNSFRLAADFDLVVGCDIRSAVSRVATWRSCSHLIVERRASASWWQRAAGPGLDELRGLTDSLSVLALPAAMVLEAPRKLRRVHANIAGKSDLPLPDIKRGPFTEVQRD
jgi:hypothetical protein